MTPFVGLLADPACPGPARWVELPGKELAPDEVQIGVSFAALGRTDALLLTGLKQDLRNAVVPGMDLAGVVLASRSPRFREGDAVVATGHALGAQCNGGLAERATLPASWVMRQPEGLRSIEAMAIGTPGLGAMLAILAFESLGALPELGPVVVTGASGGLGSLAVLGLAHSGFPVVASSRRPSEAGYLRSLGATRVVGGATRPTDPALVNVAPWGAAIDVLGGATLGFLLRGLARHGVVASCGDVTGPRTTVGLHALRRAAACVLGIDGVNAGRSWRVDAWERWAEIAAAAPLDCLLTTVDHGQAVDAAQLMASGRGHGRFVVRMSGVGGAAPSAAACG